MRSLQLHAFEPSREAEPIESDHVDTDEIFGRRPTPTPWPSSRAVLALVVGVLPTLKDDLSADLLEHLALTLIDRGDELRAVRAVLSAALDQSREQHFKIVRLQGALARLRDAHRVLRARTIRQAEAV